MGLWAAKQEGRSRAWGGERSAEKPRRDPRRRLPPAHPPLKVPMSQRRVASAPLTKTVCFRLVSGTHFLFHLSDLITPPL